MISSISWSDLSSEPAERQSQIVVERQKIKQCGVLEQESHLAAHARKLFAFELGDILAINPNVPGIGLNQGDDELQRDALTGSAPADNADRLPWRDGQVNVLEHLPFTERF